MLRIIYAEMTLLLQKLTSVQAIRVAGSVPVSTTLAAIRVSVSMAGLDLLVTKVSYITTLTVTF